MSGHKILLYLNFAQNTWLIKKLNIPEATGEATENESSQKTKLSEVQTESGTHIINIATAMILEMNPIQAFVDLKVATNKLAD
jgi:hypothetical protein